MPAGVPASVRLHAEGRAVQRGLDVVNATNSDATLTYNQTYNPTPATAAQTWLAPTSVLTARFLKVSAQIDF